MALYIFAALLFWNPPTGARGATPDSTLRDWADTIAMVCDTPLECLYQASIASEETRFAPYVLDGRCNDAGWRALHIEKACDSGLAFGPWQIQAHAWASVSSEDERNAGPLAHAQAAVKLLRKNPLAWSVWDVARRKAETYIAHHVPELPRE